uniref:Activator of Hsp90 ATPase AHSA1-like N-terminal domain-containing protein n=1 Tax=Pyramimonas obovata TaxID=1411642 RepID=A0A7S0QVR7_9CHLO|mmetsp:Transcript_14549/g.31171  ORF Transcript_14549/g.31171 Transcript_14549/m.31171 type:complete len:257 (+) Transcript_14549:263-1033(+)|eukprot:CAMPEP_0118953024 /NCGR_PEP_ID=MMETSP1169-20130426/55818_1 /TAXON_ID=36882 /ORGANISM="Pyramimonas obovata, Strain CCMP722" /LENGTH=256 /DNA_ID=CAMNT_0006900379 /DNA_START=165 /DNA_END=935 /DNA_ORIENTATION=+
MPVDYSKWDNLDLSDDDEAPPPPPKKKIEETKAVKSAAAPKLDAPQAAAGSSWNLNSWHFEESKYDKWGEDRLRELLNKQSMDAIIQHDGLELDFHFALSLTKIEGEAWTHVKKGKKSTGYNYEMEITWMGTVQGGSQRQQCQGKVEYELTVDDDEPSVVISCEPSYPFSKQMKECVTGFINKQCAVMVKELALKGGGSGDGWKLDAKASNVQVGQYQKYTDGVDGTAKAAELAAQISKTGDGSKQKKLHTDVKTF